jgi:hypothetical protein
MKVYQVQDCQRTCLSGIGKILNMRNGGKNMKRLFSSAFSLLTSAALLFSAAPLFSSAEDSSAQYADVSDGTQLTINELSRQALSGSEAVTIGSNYDYENGAYNLGYFLDENNVEVYKAMMKLITPSIDEVIVTLPEPIVIESSSWYFDINRNEASTAIFSACRSGIQCASFDIPELFWLDVNNTSVGARSVVQNRLSSRKYTYTVYQLTISPAYYSGFTSFDEVMEYKTRLEAAVESFEVTGSTRYEQIKCIHDTIAHFTTYDLEGRFSGSCLGALVEPGVVCEGYAKAFKLICDRIGIPCVCIFGNYDQETATAHMWNYVQMEDGNWYGIDVTWDDYDGKYGYEIVYDFFLKGSKSFFTNHTEGTEYALAYFTYPTISENDFAPKKPITTTTTSTSSTTSTTTTTTTTTATTSTTTASTTTTTKPPTTTTTTTTASTTTTAATTKKPKTTTTTATTTAAPTTTTTTTTEPVGYEYGDVNHDGTVSIADLVACARCALGKKDSHCYDDLDDDGIVDSFDVIVLRKLLTTTIVATADKTE